MPRNATVTRAAQCGVMVTERVAVLMIRAWVEPRLPSGMRISVRYTGEVGQQAWHTVNLVSGDDVARLLGAWLEGIESTAPPPAPPATPAEDAWLDEGDADVR